MLIKSDDMLNETSLYKYIEQFATDNRLENTAAALPFARDMHSGQLRKGPNARPYIVHPLQLARHAISLGIDDDGILSAALLHDVCEDCGVNFCELPVCADVQNTVKLLTFKVNTGESKSDAKARYFTAIKGDKKAIVIKLLDRCNNLSHMSNAFTPQRMKEYIEETRRYILPLGDLVTDITGVYALIYHITALTDSISALLAL